MSAVFSRNIASRSTSTPTASYPPHQLPHPQARGRCCRVCVPPRPLRAQFGGRQLQQRFRRARVRRKHAAGAQFNPPPCTKVTRPQVVFSNTKAVTAICVAMCVDRGLLHVTAHPSQALHVRVYVRHATVQRSSQLALAGICCWRQSVRDHRARVEPRMGHAQPGGRHSDAGSGDRRDVRRQLRGTAAHCAPACDHVTRTPGAPPHRCLPRGLSCRQQQRLPRSRAHPPASPRSDSPSQALVFRSRGRLRPGRGHPARDWRLSVTFHRKRVGGSAGS